MISIYDLDFKEVIKKDIKSLVETYSNDNIYRYMWDKYSEFVLKHDRDSLIILYSFVDSICSCYKERIKFYHTDINHNNGFYFEIIIKRLSAYKHLKNIIETSIRCNPTFL